MIKVFFATIKNAKAHSEKFFRKVLSTHFNIDGDSVVILKNDYGKPYLKDYPNVHFNISHTIGAIVCAVADSSVGIDIERIKPLNKSLVERFYAQNEQDYILNSIPGREERFAEIWTKKEAYVKWLGKGMEVPFETFDVQGKLGEIVLSVQFTKDKYVSVCTEKISALVIFDVTSYMN